MLVAMPDQGHCEGYSVSRAAHSRQKFLKPRRRHLRIAHRVLDIAVAEIGLQGARIVSSVRKRVATGVPEHVRVRPK